MSHMCGRQYLCFFKRFSNNFTQKIGLKTGEVKKKTSLLWNGKDKRDIAIISTCQDASMHMSSGYKPKLKQKAVLEYNARKKGIEVSDQLSSYYDPKRKSLTWYKKVA